MIGMDILKPAVVLMGWTLVMWVWMYATRIPAMRRVKGLDIGSKVGGTGRQLDDVLPERVQWIAHNYNHLHEAPTVFYAAAIVLAIIGQGDGVNAWFAWGYVALRIAHSLVQAISNRVMVRFALFALSTLLLIGLVLHAAIAVFHG